MERLDANDPAHVTRAAEVLRSGGLVAFPTETVYGLGADASDAKSVARVFEAKARPAFDPLIVHVPCASAAKPLWSSVPPGADALAARFWPGPLTIVLPKASAVPDIVTAGLPTVAVRVPAHPAALKFLEAAGRPVAAPSANRFGRRSPTTAAAVVESLGDAVDAILDGGPCAVGVESTVVKWDGPVWTVLRPGGVAFEDLEGIVPVLRGKKGSAVESPGQLESHYAPHTPLVLLDRPLEALVLRLGRRRAGALLFKRRAVPDGFVHAEFLSESGDAREAASKLFEALRKLDKMGLDLVVAEPAPPAGLGEAIQDRLRKASHGRTIEDFI